MLAFIDQRVRQVDDVVVPLVWDVLHKVAKLFAHVLGALEREIVEEIGAIHHGGDELFPFEHFRDGFEFLQLFHALREQGFYGRKAVSDGGGILAFLYARQVFRFNGKDERVEAFDFRFAWLSGKEGDNYVV